MRAFRVFESHEMKNEIYLIPALQKLLIQTRSLFFMVWVGCFSYAANAGAFSSTSNIDRATHVFQSEPTTNSEGEEKPAEVMEEEEEPDC